jgi:hypothetical protein
MKTKIIVSSIFLSLSLVNFGQAATFQLVTCGQNVSTKQTTSTGTNQANENNESKGCDLRELVNLVFRIVNFLIGSATLLAIGMFFTVD